MVGCCGKSSKAQVSPSTTTCGAIKCAPPKILNCDNGLTQLSRNLVLAVIIKNIWNVPGCGEIATLYAQNVKNIPVGVFLWSADYGYFEVVGYDNITGKIQVTNACVGGEINIGKTIPKCYPMILVSAPGVLQLGSSVFLASDFVAPSLNNCVTVQVTSSLFLTQGGTIQLGEAAYLLDDIIDDTSIRICNVGNGFAVGTFIKALMPPENISIQLQIWVQQLRSKVQLEVNGNLVPPNFTLNATTSAVVTNVSDAKETLVFWTVIVTFTNGVTGNNTENLSYLYKGEVTIGSDTVVEQDTQELYSFDDTISYYQNQVVITGVTMLAPLESKNISADGFLGIISPAVAGGAQIDETAIVVTLTTFQKYV